MNMLPSDAYVHLCYKCPKCERTHWKRDSQTFNSIKIECPCGTLLVTEEIATIKVNYILKRGNVEKAVRLLMQYGYKRRQILPVIRRVYINSKMTIQEIIKQTLKKIKS